MLFRSFYWQGAANLIRDQGLWGIGADNFGRYFTRYKDVECPEDVEDPHSWPVKALSEWGVLGLLALAVLVMGVWPKPFAEVLHVSINDLLGHVAQSKVP